MDSLTQAALGAAVGEAVLGEKLGWKAGAVGAIIATIPDLDVLLTPFFTRLQNVSIHRGYSHSILFCVLLALLLAYLLRRFKWTQTVDYGKLWLLSFLALFTHVVLDAFTTYGTQLFLPFNDWRVSFDSINIVDPFYTVPLLVGVLLSMFYFKADAKRRALANQLGLIVSTVYLLFTLANKQAVENVFTTALEQQGIAYYRLLTVPVKVGNMVWYGVANDGEKLHMGKYSRLTNDPISFESFPINDQLLDGLNPELTDRMKWFAQDFYVVAQAGDTVRIYNMQCDMQGIRYFGDEKAPTAFYFEITPAPEEPGYKLTVGMHPEEQK